MVKKVGEYEVHRSIGSGTYSRVHHGVFTPTGAKVAVKMLDRRKMIKENVEEQFREEYARVRQLSHTTVIYVQQIMFTKHHMYVVMELVNGRTLFDKIMEKGKLTEELSRKYFSQILDFLDYIHGLGYIHRNLTPHGILVDDTTDAVKVVDYTHCVQLEVPCFETCGSANYVAPEVLCETGYNQLVDVWSAGVILAVMVSGFLPFDASSMNGLLDIIEAGQYKLSTTITPDCADLLKSIFVTDPSMRISTEGIRNHPWFAKS
eukprot:PhM_4_TR14024/c0_g1_i1/m.16104